MIPWTRPFAAACALSMTTAFVPARAFAGGEEKQACIAASERAQHLRRESKLLAAREQLVLCSRSECPGLIRQDCAQWMVEVIANLPSVVVGARDSAGRDAVHVRVIIDRTIATETLDGRPIPLDPGEHTVRYEMAGADSVEDRILIRQGEKNRSLNVAFPARATAPVAAAAANDTPNEKPNDGAKRPGPPVITYALAGIGVVALGGAVFFELKGNSDADYLDSRCGDHCLQADRDAVDAKHLAAGVSLGVGVVSLGVAAYLYFSRPAAPASSSPKLDAWQFDVKPVPGGGGFSIRF